MLSLPRENFRSLGALACFVLTVVVGLGLDLWTKAYAFERLAVYGRGAAVVESRVYPLIPGWLEFTVTTNQGAVFGLGAGQRMLFVSVSVAAILFLIYLFANSGQQRFYQVILGMLLAGVLGNLYDRVVYGYVRDMIHALPRWPRLFPWIFNVADVLLCTGVGLMVLYSLLHSGKEPQNLGAGKPQMDTDGHR
jgi:signal peptidase II